MKSTGVTRKIDELGRIVIPKEIRRNLGIRDGESLEIYTDDENIILKKHSQIKKYEDIGAKISELISNIFDVEIIITDREKVIATSNNKSLLSKNIDNRLINMIDNRESLNNKEATIEIDNTKISGYFSIRPIIAESDSLGLVIVKSNDNLNYDKIADLIVKIMSEKLDIY